MNQTHHLFAGYAAFTSADDLNSAIEGDGPAISPTTVSSPQCVSWVTGSIVYSVITTQQIGC